MHMNKTSFSKLVYIVMLSVSVLLTLSALVGYICGETYAASLTTLTTVWVGASAVYGAFYAWKAKTENRSKYAQLWVSGLAERYGIDSVIKIVEIILRGD